MTIRQTIPKPEPGVGQLPNGYSGSDQPSDFFIPSCGIEDVDRAVFNLFDKELGFSIQKIISGQNKPVNIKKPTVIFATGERFAIVKKLRPVRDRNGALMLPAISIRRTNIIQSDEDMHQRGINQTTGELIIKRRLDPSDKSYQSLINKSLLKNADLPQTLRETGQNANDPSIRDGMLLDPKLGNNVFEIISIPQPQFYTATYEIVYWTSFTGHMNYMIETTLSSQLPQGKMFKLVTDKGYWFIGSLDDEVTSQDNFDDFTEQERIIRYMYTVKVKAFLLANNGPGTSVPFKRYVSAVDFSFDVTEGKSASKAQIEKLEDSQDPFILSDLERAPESAQEPTVMDRIVFERSSRNPITGKLTTGYVRAIQRGMRGGETVYTASDTQTLDEFLLGLKNQK